MLASINETLVITETELVQHRFVPTVVYVRETGGFHSRLCVYNYFSELFPKVTTGARVNMWFFDTDGNCIARRSIPLPYRGQLQFEVAELGINFEGTAGLSMVPETLPEFSHQGVATGYYVGYHDDAGHVDHSHEWEPMRFSRTESAHWLCAVRPLVVPETELILMNGYYGSNSVEGTAQWTATLRNDQGEPLAVREMRPIPPRGMMRQRLEEIFPDIQHQARREKTLAVQASGTNIQGPFTFVRAPNGDFNIHHFC